MADSVADDQAPVTGDAPDVEKLQAENVALRDRLLRALADAENTRRRADRSAADARQYAVADFARELLTVVDNLQRAIAAAEASAQTDASLLEGVRAIERILLGTLERFGVRKIEALGARFDPAVHEAMMEMEDAAHPPGTVARVIEDGYMIKDRLLRPARVAVAKAPAEKAPSPDRERHLHAERHQARRRF